MVSSVNTVRLSLRLFFTGELNQYVRLSLRLFFTGELNQYVRLSLRRHLCRSVRLILLPAKKKYSKIELAETKYFLRKLKYDLKTKKIINHFEF